MGNIWKNSLDVLSNKPQSLISTVNVAKTPPLGFSPIRKTKNIVEKQNYYDSLVSNYGEGIKGRQNYIELYDKVIPAYRTELDYSFSDEDKFASPVIKNLLLKKSSLMEVALKGHGVKQDLAYDKLYDIQNEMNDLSPKETHEKTSIRSILDSKKNIYDKSLLVSSFFDEGADRFIEFTNNKKPMNDKETFLHLNGYGDFGLDTAADYINDFSKKGYINPEIKNRIIINKNRNEKDQSVNSLDFLSIDDILEVKNAYFLDSASKIKEYTKSQNINLDKKALDYFIIASFNYGPTGVKKMITDYNRAGILKNDKFMDDNSYSGYREVHRNVKRRLQASEMLRGEKIIID